MILDILKRTQLTFDRQSVTTTAVSTYEYFNVEFRSGLRIKERAEISLIGVSKSIWKIFLSLRKL